MIFNKIIDAGDHNDREAETVSTYFAKELLAAILSILKTYFFIPTLCIQGCLHPYIKKVEVEMGTYMPGGTCSGRLMRTRKNFAGFFALYTLT
jgi:hypothetical protein